MGVVSQQGINEVVDWLVKRLCSHSPVGNILHHINMPFNYPNGTSVGVYIHRIGEEYAVSDGGDGYGMACWAGVGDMFLDNAFSVARQCGACYDMGNAAFVMTGFKKEELSAIVSFVAGASFLAVHLAVMTEQKGRVE